MSVTDYEKVGRVVGDGASVTMMRGPDGVVRLVGYLKPGASDSDFWHLVEERVREWKENR